MDKMKNKKIESYNDLVTSEEYPVIISALKYYENIKLFFLRILQLNWILIQ